MKKIKKKGKQLTTETKKRAVDSYGNGETAIHIAQILGVERETVHRWIREDKTRGLGRKKSPGSGRRPKINSAAKKELIKMIKKPASKFGFETDLWNIPRMVIVCQKVLKLKVSRSAIWRILRKEGFTYKKVQKKYLEANKQAQTQWKKNFSKN